MCAGPGWVFAAPLLIYTQRANNAMQDIDMALKNLSPELSARLLDACRKAGVPPARLATLKPISPWNYRTPFALALQQEIAYHDAALADELAALAGGAEDSLLIEGERAQLLAEGREDVIGNYSPQAQALLAELRPGEAATAKAAAVAAETARLDEQVAATTASRPEREQARREAERVARQSGQAQLERMLQASSQLGG